MGNLEVEFLLKFETNWHIYSTKIINWTPREFQRTDSKPVPSSPPSPSTIRLRCSWLHPLHVQSSSCLGYSYIHVLEVGLLLVFFIFTLFCHRYSSRFFIGATFALPHCTYTDCVLLVPLTYFCGKVESPPFPTNNSREGFTLSWSEFF